MTPASLLERAKFDEHAVDTFVKDTAHMFVTAQEVALWQHEQDMKIMVLQNKLLVQALEALEGIRQVSTDEGGDDAAEALADIERQLKEEGDAK